MTVQKLYVKNKYIGDGNNTVFPITFEWAKKHPESIQVWIRNSAGALGKTDNFMLKTSSNEDIWDVVYPSVGEPLGKGESIIIVRELPLLQVLNLVNQGPYFADDIEITFDEIVMMIQQLNERLARSFKVAVDIDGENTFDTTVPIEPGKTFRVKDDGTGFEVTEDPGQVLSLAKAELEALVREHAEAVKDLTDIKDEAETAKTDAQNAANKAEETVNKAVEEAYDDVKDLVEQRVQDAKGYAEEAETQAGGARGYADNAKGYAEQAEQYAEELSDTIDKVDNVRSYTDYMGWIVFKVDDTNYIAGRAFENKNITLSKYADYTWMSPTLEVPLPFPSSVIDVSGTCDSNGVYITNVNGNSINNGTGVVTFRLGRGGNPGKAIDAYVRMTLVGQRADAPASPTIAHNAEGAAQIISIAQTYVNARVNGRKFTYGRNFFYNNYDYINDSRGYAQMECDTFVGMCIRGIPYEQSPFANTTPNYQFSYSNLVNNPNGYVWCNNVLTDIASTNTLLGRDAKYVSDMSFLYWRKQGCIFTDINEAKTGDLVFFRKPTVNEAFDNVSHIALLSIENGVKYIYHVSSENLTEGRVVEKMLLADRPNPPCYFARIDYSNS